MRRRSCNCIANVKNLGRKFLRIFFVGGGQRGFDIFEGGTRYFCCVWGLGGGGDRVPVSLCIYIFLNPFEHLLWICDKKSER